MNENLINNGTTLSSYTVSYNGTTTVTNGSGLITSTTNNITSGSINVAAQSQNSQQAKGIVEPKPTGNNIYEQLKSQIYQQGERDPNQSQGLQYAPDYNPFNAYPSYPSSIPAQQITTIPLGGTIGTGGYIGLPDYGTNIQIANGMSSFKFPKTYSLEEVDNLIKLLTLWIDDRELINKMEKMYKHWKAMEEKQNK